MNSPLRIISDGSPSAKGCGGGCTIAKPRAPLPHPGDAFRGRAALITLGCAKNQVDSEVMIGILHAQGFEIVTDVTLADVAVVNTCGFLESAVRESIDAILSVAENKKDGRLRRLIVAGCAVSRYRDELTRELPEVDAFLTTEEITRIGEAATSDGSFGALLAQAERPYFLYDETVPRALSSTGASAYVKIAEGCNRPCAFCIIPKIRGQLRSRTIPSIVRESQLLGEQGIKEINLVAQDLTDFGSDHKNGNLTDLLEALDRAGAVEWIRLLYAYPLGINSRLLRSIVDLPRVCSYLDLPLQHASERVLREMQRPLGKYAPRRLVETIRREAPEIALRTTFIVGFPGERDEDVEELLAFVSEGHFTSVGVFTYSPESGTPAGERNDQIAPKIREARRRAIMEAQQRVVSRRLPAEVGRRHRVLIEGPHEDTDLLLVGRTQFQAPEVDGAILINELPETAAGEPLVPLSGTFVEVEVTEVVGYDLMARVDAAPSDRASPQALANSQRSLISAANRSAANRSTANRTAANHTANPSEEQIS